MQSVDCPFCEHANLAGAKFCNECGSPLHFAPCKHCGAVNRIDDAQCYRCGVALNAPRVPSQAAHVDPEAASSNPDSMRLEQKAQWLERELLRLENPGADMPDPHAKAEDHAAISTQTSGELAPDLAPNTIEHKIGPLDTADREARGNHARIDRASELGAKRRRSSAQTRGRSSMPEMSSLFSEVAKAPRVSWRELAAGLAALILMLAIAAGAYFYYLENLAPNVTMAEHRAPESGVLARESRTTAMNRTSVTSGLPLTKNTPAPPDGEPDAAASPAPVGNPVESGQSFDPSAVAVVAAPQMAVTESSSDAIAVAQCPPAVAAIALCDWFRNHASRN